MGRDQRPEADVNIEYRITSKYAEEAMQLARKFQFANETYATDYPANIGPHMTNTDSGPFQIGNGWDPHHHQATDLYVTYSDDDFRLGLNAAQTTLSASATRGRQTSSAKMTILRSVPPQPVEHMLDICVHCRLHGSLIASRANQ